MIEIITDKWNDIFHAELENTVRLRIISPFITDTVIRGILHKFKGKKIEVITRFNLNDFRSGVSSIKALERLIDAGASIQGISGLHSKLYLFDNRGAIITSANLTNKAFYNNYEFGICTNDQVLVSRSSSYFEWLQRQGGNLLTKNNLEYWQELINNSPALLVPKPLPDFGIIPTHLNEPQYWIKFLGNSNLRAGDDFDTKEEIARAHCHFALCYPKNRKRPMRYHENDVVFIARMTHNDYAIFGRALAMAHIEGRDYLPEADRIQTPWKANYPYYIRIKEPVFLDTMMGNCPKMSELIERFGNESFFKLQQRFLNGEQNLNPRDSLKQRADIRLSTIAGIWLEEIWEAKITGTSKVKKSYLKSLYSGASS